MGRFPKLGTVPLSKGKDEEDDEDAALFALVLAFPFGAPFFFLLPPLFFFGRDFPTGMVIVLRSLTKDQLNTNILFPIGKSLILTVYPTLETRGQK